MLFSIITVSYNSSATISRTISSVLSQSCKDFEYIIIDGASTDGTQDIIKSYERDFNEKLKWISEKDNGIFSAMNKGLRLACGDIIGIVNSDDWLEPTTLENVEKCYKSRGNELENVLYCGAIRYHYNNASQILYPNLDLFNSNVCRYLSKGIWHPGMFVSSKVYKKIGLFDEKFKIMADSDFIYRCYINSVDFVEIPQVLNNMSYGGASNILRIYIRDYYNLLRKYEKNKINFWIKFCKEVVRVFIRSILPNRVIKIYRDTY